MMHRIERPAESFTAPKGPTGVTFQRPVLPKWLLLIIYTCNNQSTSICQLFHLIQRTELLSIKPPRCELPLIANIRLTLHHIKRRLRTEPTRTLTPHRLGRVCRILIVNLDRLATPTRTRRIRHHLHLTALLQAHEPEYRTLDRLADRQ
jgi:hypothetical protein